MPNYDDDAISCGWTKKGSKWVHRDHPGEEFYNAKQIYPLLPCPPRRPLSATPREPMPVTAPTEPEMPKRGRPAKPVENKS
jgi:hypothetical protein